MRNRIIAGLTATKAGIAAGVVLVLLIAVVGAAAFVPQWGVTLPIALPSIK